MALYYGLPFGVYALMMIIQDSVKSTDNIIGKAIYVSQRIFLLIVVFIGTFIVLYLPFIQSSGLAGV